jgi:hypothetical protein
MVVLLRCWLSSIPASVSFRADHCVCVGSNFEFGVISDVEYDSEGME